MDTLILRNIVGDDEATVREFLALFRTTAQRQRAEMHAACAVDGALQAGAIAHKLQSSSRTVGAQALAHICAAIENAGKTGDLATVRKHLTALDLEWQQEQADINSYLGNDSDC